MAAHVPLQPPLSLLNGKLKRVQVEFPDGRTTLCLLPAKFHKKLWIKKGNYLIVEDSPEATDSRVTGQILAVLFVDHVKQLKRMQGIWCEALQQRA
jgi:probable RNA-binding protein EIF1AD